MEGEVTKEEAIRRAVVKDLHAAEMAIEAVRYRLTPEWLSRASDELGDTSRRRVALELCESIVRGIRWLKGYVGEAEG